MKKARERDEQKGQKQEEAKPRRLFNEQDG